MSISDLPILLIGVTVFLLVTSIFLKFSAPLIVVAALVGDFIASTISNSTPSIDAVGQNITPLVLFFTPIILIMILTRKRHGHSDALGILVGMVSLPVVGLLMAKHNYDMSQSLSSSMLGLYTTQVNIYIGAALLVAILVLGVGKKPAHKRHHKE